MQLQDKIVSGFRLSPQQKRLWNLQQNSLAYQVQGAILIEGNLDKSALKLTLHKVIQRHEILRTSFCRSQDVKIPIQVISTQANLVWNEIDLSKEDSHLQTHKIGEIIQEERLKVGNFEQADLFQVALVQLSIKKHILVLTLPSLCADKQSLQNLLLEISRTYSACLLQEDLSNDDIIQYIQFSEWQNQLLEDEEDIEGKEFWQQQSLGDAEVKLPFELNQTNNSSKLVINNINLEIDKELFAAITQSANNNCAAIANFFLTCWQILLWRLTKNSQLVIGTACNGRQYEELANAIGLFTKYLPLSIPSQPNYCVEEVLQQVEKVTQQYSQWQDYFADETIAKTQQFLLQFCFEFNTQPASCIAGDVTLSLIQQYAYLERFKINLSCTQKTDNLIATFEYDANLFEREYIQRLADYFYTLVKSAIAFPKSPITQLQILNQHHQKELLNFNNNQVKFPQYSCIHQLFEQQVERAPDNIAVICDEQKLTYAELNSKANQLAWYLQKLGVKAEVVVGIYAERSLNTIIAILAIFKAGGAYLPLDPAYPQERLTFMLEDSSVPILLTQQHLKASLPQTQARIICLDTDWEKIEKQANYPLSPSPHLPTSSPPHLPTSSPPHLLTSPLAYIIYTSGSTGTPKGVAVEHQQLLNYIQAINISLDLPNNANWALVSTFAADLGNTAIFSALSAGGCLHILSSDKVADAEAMKNYCNQHPIDCLKIVPSHLKALLTTTEPAAVLPRQRLILGGEALDWELVEQIRHLAPKCSIFNHYGPTEATVGVLTYLVEEEKTCSQTVPLGKAIANTQVYLLDEHLQNVPIGISGEIYIGGAGVARGYLNQPDLTQKRFIANPIANSTSARLYKTGDLGRYLPDGNIEYLGRIDEQVKIRGYRVELGEIAAIISQYPAVQQAVVLFPDERLVAYIVPRIAQTINTQQLKHFLQERLPEYMIPVAFVLLKTIPLTPNGKIDRQSLPTGDRPETATFTPPRTQIELDLAVIWQNILNLEQIGIHDNFFDLGGHSLLLTQLLAKVRAAFQIDLPLRTLFAAPTIAQLAASIETAGKTNSAAIDLNAEAILDPTIQPDTLPPPQIAQPKAILLTGATGFLGAFLLWELLQQTQAEIYCLVRAKDIESGRAKIRAKMASYAIWDAAKSSRIIPIIGELSQPLLGLSPAHFQHLTNQIDFIYHNGAFVNFTLPYTALKAANVLGTEEILRLASRVKLKPVHFISSTSVAVPNDTSNIKIISEQDFPTADRVMEGGYPQTKWVAEKLVKIAGDRGLPISIYRPGRISWHSQTGICNLDDHTSRTIAGCIQLGAAPDLDALVNLAPVDYVSQAIVHLSRQQASIGKTFHIVNPQPAPWHQFVSIVRSFGYSIKTVSEQQWREKLLKIAQGSPKHPLYPLIPIMLKQVSEEEIATSSILHFDCQNTQTGLTQSAIACPSIDINLLTPYFAYLSNTKPLA